jgi:ABC-type nitrate/sulfonate/bicarbonate transport system substrate-binding protein
VAWRDLSLTSAPFALLFVIMVGLIVWLADPAPPRTITISAGPHDSSLLHTADEYKKILARNGVTLKVLESDGSVQNLQRLMDPKSHVDLALVQGGVSDAAARSSLMSLGSVFYVPTVVFYRGKGMTQLSELEGKRIAIGREGSGTRRLSLNLLEANGITPGGDTQLVPLDGRCDATGCGERGCGAAQWRLDHARADAQAARHTGNFRHGFRGSERLYTTVSVSRRNRPAAGRARSPAKGTAADLAFDRTDC